MQTIDLKKDLKHLYKPSGKTISVVDVPPMNYLMIDGEGAPGTPVYSQSVSALYTLAYGLRFAVKDQQQIAFTVMPLEGLWWAEDMTQFSSDNKDDWKWTMMILQPEQVTAELVEETRAAIAKKKKPPLLERVYFGSYHEGPSVQIMYTGPYADEGPTIIRMHDHVHQNGHHLTGKHHEIYISNPGRVAPEKLKTVIRQPFNGG